LQSQNCFRPNALLLPRRRLPNNWPTSLREVATSVLENLSKNFATKFFSLKYFARRKLAVVESRINRHGFLSSMVAEKVKEISLVLVL
jgi:hypothetical protein